MGVSFMDGRNRSDVTRGADVSVVLKEDQPTGKQTRGIVQGLLTKSPFHPHGIKVRLQGGKVGRVQVILCLAKISSVQKMARFALCFGLKRELGLGQELL